MFEIDNAEEAFAAAWGVVLGLGLAVGVLVVVVGGGVGVTLGEFPCLDSSVAAVAGVDVSVGVPMRAEAQPVNTNRPNRITHSLAIEKMPIRDSSFSPGSCLCISMK